MRLSILVLVVTLLSLGACKKDTIKQEPLPEPAPAPTPTPTITPTVPTGPGNPHELTINFTAIVNNQLMVPRLKYYTNQSTDSFSVSKLNYYISNIKLKREDGVVFSEPESYHLIRHVEEQTYFTIKGIPEGKYYQMEYLIGVDSLRNVSGAQTGALDVANEMFWEWNSGYIFFKMEGSYKTANTPAFADYAIHIGGFSGPLSCLQTCNFYLSTPIVASKDKKSKLYFKTIVDEVFIKPNYIDFDTYYGAVNTKTFKQISDNYKDMLVVERVEN